MFTNNGMSRRQRAAQRDSTQSDDDTLGELLAGARCMWAQAQEEGRPLFAYETRTFNAAIDAALEIDPDNSEAQALRAEVEQLRPMRSKLEQPGAGAMYSGGADSLRITSPYSGPTLRCFANTVRGREDGHAFGMWLHANLLGNGKAAQWCEDHGVPVDFRAAHSTSEAVKGGVLVPEQYSANIVRLVEEYGVIRQSAQIFPMTSDTAHVPRRASGLTAVYTGEGQAIDESDTGWSDVQLSARKLAVLTRFSSELNEDSAVAIADLLAMEVALAFAQQEDDSCLNGSGTSASGGIYGVLTKAIDGTHTNAVATATAGHNLLGEVTADDIVTLMSKVPTFAKSTSAFYCSPTALSLIFDSIKMSAGGADINQLQNQVAPRFLGYPIRITPLMADSATTDYTGLPMVAFGDLRLASLLGVRRDLRIALSEHVYFTSDQIALKATMRHDYVAHSLGDNSTTKSPFCVLVGA